MVAQKCQTLKLGFHPAELIRNTLFIVLYIRITFVEMVKISQVIVLDIITPLMETVAKVATVEMDFLYFHPM